MELPIIKLKKPAKEIVKIVVEDVVLDPSEYTLNANGIDVQIQTTKSWPEDVSIRVEYHPLT